MQFSKDLTPAGNRRMGKFVIVLGVLALLVSFWLGAHKLLFYVSSLEAQGTLRAVKGETLPAVEFRTIDGKTVLFEPEGRGYDSAYIGKRVDVVYSETQPEHAYINSVTQLWRAQLISGYFSVALLLAGYLTLRGHLEWWRSSFG
ncbi:hypothetical protein F2P45_13630 [Massilia sp. CCM 8733]|uniref:DUF3592 domain-containing protein n=1 Tax=Massilia mucilaginosa TaxID=2609282 RepID=A0ABX0NTA2_9BURK|nr:DUF3592 domain-containing protein [Massilia mucilaginosa]NHZ90047.1 hypothetical protein [Massilia mucilaginosa]